MEVHPIALMQPPPMRSRQYTTTDIRTPPPSTSVPDAAINGSMKTSSSWWLPPPPAQTNGRLLHRTSGRLSTEWQGPPPAPRLAAPGEAPTFIGKSESWTEFEGPYQGDRGMSNRTAATPVREAKGMTLREEAQGQRLEQPRGTLGDGRRIALQIQSCGDWYRLRAVLSTNCESLNMLHVTSALSQLSSIASYPKQVKLVSQSDFLPPLAN